MPMLVAGAILPLIVNSPLFFLGPAAVSAIATGVGYAAVAGATLLAQRLTAKEQPKPEDVQTNFRQAVPTRVVLYGQGKIGGPWVFAETNDGSFHRVIALSSRQLTAILEYWVDDRLVTIDGSGWVQTDELDDQVRIQTRMGLPTETHYASLAAIFPEWTSNHRGDGVASLYAHMTGVKPENVTEVYPSGINTMFRVVATGATVFDPREPTHDIDDAATWEYSDNLALVVLDYMHHADGMRLPLSLLSTPLALAGWEAAADDCDDAIALKAGGTEPRYRIWGTYRYDERPGDVLRRFMAAGNARFVPTSDGGLTIEVGKWRAPTVTVDETMIVGFDGVGRGKAIMETANTITAQFTSPLHDYQATDADPWIDDADVSERGEITASAEYICAPSHSQCRRLMKIEAHRANPAWVGTFVCNLKALPAFGERFIHLTYEAFEIDDDFELLDFQFVFGEHSTLKGVILNVQSISEDAFSWNAATEEGTAPPVESTEDDHVIPAVAGFDAVLFRKTVSGVLVPFANITWTAPVSDSLLVELRGRRTVDTAWIAIGVDNNETTAESFVLDDGQEYEFQARYRTVSGRVGAWSASEVLTALGDSTSPGDLSGVSVGGALLGSADVAFTAPVSENVKRVKVYRNTSGTLNRVTDLIESIPVYSGQAIARTVGTTGTNLLTNGDFTSSAGWTIPTDVTISGGVATKVAGALSAFLSRVVALSNGVAYRMGITVNSHSAGSAANFRFTGGAIVTAGTISGTGRKVAAVTATAAHTAAGIVFGPTVAMVVDDIALIAPAVGMLTQGTHYFWMVAENGSGVEGTLSGPHSVTVT